MVTCPGCGARFVASTAGLGGHDEYDASPECWEAFGALFSFVAAHSELGEWHQVAIDAFTLQHLRPEMKPIKVAFALNGLYLVFERSFTGTQARAAHGHLANTVRSWPTFDPATSGGEMHAADVAIDAVDHCAEDMATWGRSVWDAWSHLHDEVAELTDAQLGDWQPPRR